LAKQEVALVTIEKRSKLSLRLGIGLLFLVPMMFVGK
jgi:hypothetical protein